MFTWRFGVLTYGWAYQIYTKTPDTLTVEPVTVRVNALNETNARRLVLERCWGQKRRVASIELLGKESI